MQTTRIFLFIYIFLFTVFTNIHAQKLTLDPQQTLIAVNAKDAFTKVGSTELQKQLRRIYRTDKGFEFVNDDQVKKNMADISKKSIISFGPTYFTNEEKLTTASIYAFTIRKKGNIVMIMGLHPMGYVNGMAYFLDNYCGVRFYLPTELYTSLPKLNKITLPEKIDITQEPFVAYTLGTGLTSAVENEGNWAWYNGLTRKNWESHQHSMGQRFPTVEFKDKYPEIYPLMNGKRYFPANQGDQNWQPDFAEPKLVDAAVESAINYFKQKPGLRHISFSVQDSKVYPVEGKMAEVLSKYPKSYEGRLKAYIDTYIHFLNQVAERLEKELPEQGVSGQKKIVYIVYGQVAQMPKEKLHPSIVPVVVSQISELDKDGVTQRATWNNPFRLSDWAKKATYIGHHDWAQGNGYLYPRIYTGLLAKYLKEVKVLGLKQEYYHAELYPNWGLDGPKYYLMGKLLWSPEADVEALMTQFCTDMFGKAAKPMKEYFDTLEKLTYSMDNTRDIYRKMHSFPKQLLLSPQELELVKQARTWLNQASRRTKNESEKKRIEFFSKSFRLTEYLFELTNAKEVKQEQIDEVKKYMETVILPDKMTFFGARTKGELERRVTSALQSIPNKPKPKK
ncbi:DUF4838 domain-containing protein [Rhodocytophaga rosea]|uniref:DUF4838 domain-containing protein n=1 Tax=Rhodocytophaga rosea TaxID=2704465 RepID=A0A6C0GV51_9BACT|nr:DUF4838 domain-containing protein [Rhodocytophaga rosea]QHT71230.1 DUF4838 domain-containing protein [Rhodocytophaga rosea]